MSLCSYPNNPCGLNQTMPTCYMHVLRSPQCMCTWPSHSLENLVLIFHYHLIYSCSNLVGITKPTYCVPMLRYLQWMWIWPCWALGDLVISLLLFSNQLKFEPCILKVQILPPKCSIHVEFTYPNNVKVGVLVDFKL